MEDILNNIMYDHLTLLKNHASLISTGIEPDSALKTTFEDGDEIIKEVKEIEKEIKFY